MSYLRLLAWLTIAIIVLGIAISMLPRETTIPGSQFMYPNLETSLTRFECVNETRVYPDVDSLNLYVGENEIKPGGPRSTNESLSPLLRGDYGYVDPVLYYKALATYLALFPVELGVESKRYIIAPLPYNEGQSDRWVDNRTLCMSFPWLHVNPVESALLSNTTSGDKVYVWTPLGYLNTTRLVLTYLPSFNISFNYVLTRYEQDYARGYAYSRHSAFADIMEKGCYSINNVSYCIKVYTYSITWHYYIAVSDQNGYQGISNTEEYVFNPASNGELYAERTTGDFMGYPLAKAYLRVKPVLYYQSVNESCVEIVYDAEIESGYASRGVRAVSYFITGNVSWTPYTGLNPVLKLNNSTVSMNPHPVSIYVSPLNPVNHALLFTAEDTVELFNDLMYLQRAYRGINVTRRVVQLNITYDSINTEVEITRGFLDWRGDAYIKPRLSIVVFNPPVINLTEVKQALTPHPGEAWLAWAYANATARIIESIVETIDEYKDVYRYMLSTMILSSTKTVEYNVSRGFLFIRDVLVYGEGSPWEKSWTLGLILSELRVRHNVKDAVSQYLGVTRDTCVVYAYVSGIPQMWRLPANLAKSTDSEYEVIFEPWQNTVFSDFDLVGTR